MGGIIKNFIIAWGVTSLCAPWLDIAFHFDIDGLRTGASEVDQMSVEVKDNSMIQYIDRNSSSQNRLAKEDVLSSRDLQDFEVEDMQDNFNYSLDTLKPIGVRRMWLYSMLFNARKYYQHTGRGEQKSEMWPVQAIKLAHPIDDLHGPLRKNFDRAVFVFKEIMALKPSESQQLEFSREEVDAILDSPGSMWGIPIPGSKEEGYERIVVMDGNGRAAGLKWACLSQCLAEELKVNVNVEVGAFRSEVAKVNRLFRELIIALYGCTDLGVEYDKLSNYWRKGWCFDRSVPSFGSCKNGEDVVSSKENIERAWSTAEPCIQRFSDEVNNTEPPVAMSPLDISRALPHCDWPRLMGILQEDQYSSFVQLFRSWVSSATGEPDFFKGYKLDCMYRHERQCQSEGKDLRTVRQ